MIFLCVFLILLILIQRGKGGGLAGAFGGAGGQSAFGTKAGDTFMRITIVVSIVWFLLCLVTSFYMSSGSRHESGLGLGSGASTSTTMPVVPESGTETIVPAPMTTTIPENPPAGTTEEK